MKVFPAALIPLSLVVLAAAAPAQDQRKNDIETPVEDLVALDGELIDGTPANPRVAPGKVRWHADADAARAASKASGKPVLVFQLLGRLDQELC